MTTSPHGAVAEPRSFGAGMRASEVDALRCLAMTMVMALHAGILPIGWVGVWLFYVISGYVVTRSMIGRELSANAGTRLRHFFTRRFVRIVPAYYLYVGIGLIVTLALGVGQDWLAVVSIAGFFDNYTATIGRGTFALWPTGHLWTISTEMQFYAVYGITLCVASRRTNIVLLIAMLAAGPVARFAMSAALQQTAIDNGRLAYAVYVRPGLHVDIFAMGALLAFAANRWDIARFARPLFAVGLAGLALYVGTYVFVNVHVAGTHGVASVRNIVSGVLVGQWREVFVYSAVGVAATGLVALAAAGGSPFAPLLRLRALQVIGVISYGAYLLHLLAIRCVAYVLAGSATPSIATRIGMFAASYPLVVAVAWLSYRFFEMPLNARFGSPRHAPARPS